MSDRQTPSEFNAAADRFAAPVLDYLETHHAKCTVHWVYPEETEQNHSFELPSHETEHYLRSSLGQGFFAAVKGVFHANGRSLHLVFWEESKADYKGANWPEIQGVVELEVVWPGYPGTVD